MLATSSLQHLTRHQSPCCQGYCRLVDLSHSLCHAASRLLSVVLQADRPVAFALSCRQSPIVRGAAGWSARHVCFTMPPTALSTARCQVHCGSIETLNLPVDLTEVGSASDVLMT
ncbi:hypothetical protein B296_00026372 [Ensete ventricosum]|uniref:Uncharacterized protein n=1 Tax=Ensete ventricosum TaxID=4639 RepID=A0A426YSH1_ENSVE|nr:hypothetical protein B296_00026372 [Ensete ventricosum]